MNNDEETNEQQPDSHYVKPTVEFLGGDIPESKAGKAVAAVGVGVVAVMAIGA